MSAVDVEFESIIQANFQDEPAEAKMAHHVPVPEGDPEYISRAIALRQQVRAICGYVWVPTVKDPYGYERCPGCFGGDA